MIAFTAEQQKEIVRRLVDALHPLKIYLFGSHAYGTPRRDSDVDLMVVMHDFTIPYRELAFRGRRSLRGMGIPVELHVCTQAEMEKWSKVPCNTIHTVAQKGRLIYAAPDGSREGVA